MRSTPVTPPDDPPWTGLRHELATLSHSDLTGWPDQHLRDALTGLVPALHQLGALVSAITATFNARDLAQADGHRSTRNWLTTRHRLTPAAAHALQARGELMRRLPALGAAALAGTASPEHLRKIDDLCRHVGTEQVSAFDPILAALTNKVDPADLGTACERIRHWLDPDGPEPDPDAGHRRGLTITRSGSLYSMRALLDLDGGAALITALDATTTAPQPGDERTAAQRRHDALIDIARQALTEGRVPTIGGVRPHLGLLITPDTLLTPTPGHREDGPPTTGSGSSPDISDWLPAGAAQTANHTSNTDPTAADLRPGTTDRDDPDETPDHCPNHPPGNSTHGNSTPDDGSIGNGTAGMNSHHSSGSHGDGQHDNGTHDNGTHSTGTAGKTSHRKGSGSSGHRRNHNRSQPEDMSQGEGTSPGHDVLSRAGIPPGPEPPWLNWAGHIPTAIAQRIACDCDVWRAILDPTTGLPLEVGRTHRIVPTWIRKALHARDRGCRWPGCDHPTQWTDAHHLIEWYYGGDTNINNLLLLCRWHHTKVHEGQWRIHLNPTTGEVTLTRPNGQPYELTPSQPWRPSRIHTQNRTDHGRTDPGRPNPDTTQPNHGMTDAA